MSKGLPKRGEMSKKWNKGSPKKKSSNRTSTSWSKRDNVVIVSPKSTIIAHCNALNKATARAGIAIGGGKGLQSGSTASQQQSFCLRIFLCTTTALRQRAAILQAQGQVFPRRKPWQTISIWTWIRYSTTENCYLLPKLSLGMKIRDKLKGSKRGNFVWRTSIQKKEKIIFRPLVSLQPREMNTGGRPSTDSETNWTEGPRTSTHVSSISIGSKPREELPSDLFKKYIKKSILPNYLRL